MTGWSLKAVNNLINLNISIMKSLKNLLILMFGMAFLACTNQQKNVEIMKEQAPYQKKYTNADFYKDGKLVPEIALKAYLEMLDHYGVPYSDL